MTTLLALRVETLQWLLGVDFINILRTQFSYEILAPKISTQSTAYVQNFGNKNSLSYEKRTRKTLMKLTERDLMYVEFEVAINLKYIEVINVPFAELRFSWVLNNIFLTDQSKCDVKKSTLTFCFQGWLYGIKDGNYGLFPSDFVERMSPQAIRREMRIIAKVTRYRNVRIITCNHQVVHYRKN